MNLSSRWNQSPNMRRYGLCRSENGIALAVVLGIMAVLLVLGTIVLNSIQTETPGIEAQRKQVQERLAAENAIQRILNDFRTTQDVNNDGMFTDEPVAGNVDGHNVNYNDIDGNNVNDFDQVFLRGLDIGSADNRILLDEATDNQADVWVEAISASEATIHVTGKPANSESTVEMDATVSISLLNVIHAAINNSPNEP